MGASLQLELDQAVFLPTISRASVREFVGRECKALQDAAASGGNIHQYQLDRQDSIATFAATLLPDDAATFWTLYAEEMNAASAAMLDQVAALNVETSEAAMRNVTQTAQVGTWIALILFFAGLIMMISFLKR